MLNNSAVFELILSLFACIGVVYSFREIWTFLTRKNTKTKAVLIITLSANKENAIKELLNLANFYHFSTAQRYIEKIIIKNAPTDILKEREQLLKALNIPLYFEDV